MRLDREARSARQEPALNTFPREHIHGTSWWRRAAVWPLAAAMRLWTSTLRVSVSDEDLKVVTFAEGPTIFILWHNRLFVAAEFVKRYRGARSICGIVSASKDGAWLAAYYSLVGLTAVRGSSSRLGREASGALVEVLRAGEDIGITPDGPRGPVYDFKPGAAVVARRAQARMVLVGMEFGSAWRLPSWDGFYVPRPFSKIRMRFTAVLPTELPDREEGTRLLAERLGAINPDRIPLPVKKPASP